MYTTLKAKPLEKDGSPIGAIHTKKALSLPRTELCLANVPGSKTIAEKQPGLDENSGVWTGEIDDVPAGTNVRLNVATYTGDKVTGSLEYPTQYGSYNFTLHKETGGWYFIRFTGCQG